MSTPSYGVMHYFVRRDKGQAADHPCDTCGKPAQNWAYNHRDPDERVSPDGLAYGSSPEFYVPMCIACHRAFDAARRPCGTDAAYYRHRRRGEPPCEACRRGHSDAEKRRNARRKGVAA